MAITWDATWVQSRRLTVQGALERIQWMLTRAYLSIRAVNRDKEARAIYVTYFNNASLTNLVRVTNIIRSMHDRVSLGNQNVTMSYVPDNNAFLALGVGALPAGVTIAQVEAFVVQHGVPPPTPLRLYTCPSFFTGNVYLPNAVNQRTGTGTILHELSHGVGDTSDHAYTWAPAYRSLTADQRAANADSYRAYCQAFDT